MRVTRHRSFKRGLRFFKAAFDFTDPYHVVADQSFIELAVKSEISLKNDLSEVLVGRVTPMVTSCVMCHLRKNGKNNPDALNVGKSCYRLKCNHDEKKPLSAEECILSVLGSDNARHFFIASQDEAFKVKVRRVPGTPVLSIHGKLLMLESPSHESRRASQHRELKQQIPKLCESSESESSGDEKEGEGDDAQKKKKKRRKRGQNPLSCLPKKIKPSQPAPSDSTTSPPKPKRVRSKRMRTTQETPAITGE